MALKTINCICLLMLLVAVAVPADAQDELVFAGIEGSINHITAAAILKNAYARLGIQIQTVGFPAKRALAMSNSGEYDGEVQRIDNINRQYPNLIKVPVPILYLEASVFVKKPAIRIARWEDLAPYSIGVPRGIRYLDMYTRNMNRIFVTDLEQLFQLLNIERVDVVIIAKNYGQQFLRQNHFPDIRMLEPPLIKIPLYHYLHKRHASGVSTVAGALREMWKSGRIDQIIRRYDQPG